jgi:DNA-binding response OmpR family regulator
VAKIMVIDEEVDSCRLLQRLLERCGHEVVSFTEMNGGMEWARIHPLDLVVAVLGDYSIAYRGLACRLKALNGRLRALAITNRTPDGMNSEGWDAVVVKPLEIDSVESEVSNLLES